jgi:hypothetical protein
MAQNDDDHSPREDRARKLPVSAKAAGTGKYALFIVGEILLGIAFCVAIYYYYFRKA